MNVAGDQVQGVAANMKYSSTTNQWAVNGAYSTSTAATIRTSTVTTVNAMEVIHTSSSTAGNTVLKLSTPGITDHQTGSNWALHLAYIRFLTGSDVVVGGVYGHKSGSTNLVTFVSPGADYAEYLPNVGGKELDLKPGQVVGVHGGEVSLDTKDAHQTMVVSSRPIVAGNRPQSEEFSKYTLVAMLGQVEVQVRGQVRKGDLLVPSGANDGYAVALDAKAGNRKPSQLAQVFAVAWDSHEEGGEGR